jgi:hypothetical protein
MDSQSKNIRSGADKEFFPGLGYKQVCGNENCSKPDFYSKRYDAQFCSVECKTAFNNAKNKARRARERQIIKDISRNDRILQKLYQEHRTTVLTGELVENAGFCRACYCGWVFSDKSNRPGHYYVDYILSPVPDGRDTYQIFKQDEYDLV